MTKGEALTTLSSYTNNYAIMSNGDSSGVVLRAIERFIAEEDWERVDNRLRVLAAYMIVYHGAPHDS